MTRRTIGLLVTLILAILMAPLAAAPRPTKLPRIGIIEDSPYWGAFRQGLRDLGYVEGQNIVIEERRAEGQLKRLPTLAVELVRLEVDVIVTAGTPGTLAAKQATTTIPIVMAISGDPVRVGLVASLARPGGNVTGLSLLGAELAAKRLQLLKEVIPTLSRVTVLSNPANLGVVPHIEELEAGARVLGVALQSEAVRSPHEFESAFAAIMKERPDALLLTADSLHQLHVGGILDFAARSRLPVISNVKENVIAGALMSYGTSIPELFRHAATFVDKILKGAKPADLPVEQPTKVELVINLKTAQALGLTIPPFLLFQADEVIR